MFPVHHVWPKPCWKVEENKADRRRSGKVLEFAKSQRAVENREQWRKLVVKSFVVPQWPSRLRWSTCSSTSTTSTNLVFASPALTKKQQQQEQKLLGVRAFFSAAPKLLNYLPVSLREYNSKVTFKNSFHLLWKKGLARTVHQWLFNFWKRNGHAVGAWTYPRSTNRHHHLCEFIPLPEFSPI